MPGLTVYMTTHVDVEPARDVCMWVGSRSPVPVPFQETIPRSYRGSRGVSIAMAMHGVE